jgi:two-component system response regulator FixJ
VVSQPSSVCFLLADDTGESGSAAPTPTVFVVDDDKAVRESLRWLLESVNLRVETFANADAFLERYVDPAPGCLVVDVRLPGMSGLDLQQVLRQRDVRVPVIVITGHGDVPVAVRAMKAGAIDFIEKPFSDQTLLDRVRFAMDLDANQRRDRMEELEVRRRVDRLSSREREVMEQVVEGKLNKEIAEELGLSPKTIEVHRAHVMDKMEADSVAMLVRMVMVLSRTSRGSSSPPASPTV